MRRFVVRQYREAFHQVNLFRLQRSDLAGPCSGKPEQLQEHSEQRLGVFAKLGMGLSRYQGLRPSGSLRRLTQTMQRIASKLALFRPMECGYESREEAIARRSR